MWHRFGSFIFFCSVFSLIQNKIKKIWLVWKHFPKKTVIVCSLWTPCLCFVFINIKCFSVICASLIFLVLCLLFLVLLFSVLLPPSLVWLESAVFPAFLPFPRSSGYWNTERMARVIAINCVSQPSLELSPEPTPPPLPCSWTSNHTLPNMHFDILWLITAFKIDISCAVLVSTTNFILAQDLLNVEVISPVIV